MADPIRKRWLSRAPQMALIAALALGLGLPGVVSVLHLSNMQDDVVENRRLARLPTAPRTLSAVLAYPGRFDASFNDRFGLRPTLIRWHNLMLLRGLGISPTPSVVLGNDGWLFLGAARTLAYHVARTPFSPEELAAWRAALEGRRRWLAAQGARYLLVVVPDKHTVYAEHLPLRLRGAKGPTRLDQLLADLRTNTEVTALDLRGPLLAAKPSGRLFYKTDTHWTELGGYTAYRAIIERLGDWFPGMEAWPLADFKIAGEKTSGGNLAQVLAATARYTEERITLTPLSPRLARRGRVRTPGRGGRSRRRPVAMERADASQPSAMMLYDSFGNRLIPLLAEHFARIVYVYKADLDPLLVAQERPQVVIEELAETSLMQRRPPIDPFDPGISGAGAADRPEERGGLPRAEKARRGRSTPRGN